MLYPNHFREREWLSEVVEAVHVARRWWRADWRRQSWARIQPAQRWCFDGEVTLFPASPMLLDILSSTSRAQVGVSSLGHPLPLHLQTWQHCGSSCLSATCAACLGSVRAPWLAHSANKHIDNLPQLMYLLGAWRMTGWLVFTDYSSVAHLPAIHWMTSIPKAIVFSFKKKITIQSMRALTDEFSLPSVVKSLSLSSQCHFYLSFLYPWVLLASPWFPEV